MSLEEKNENIVVNGPDINKIPCAKCKWAIGGATKFACIKYGQKPASVYYRNENCEKFSRK